LKDSARVLHLKKLSGAGITHVRLLPTFQFVGVDDQKENWRNVGKIYNVLSSEYWLHYILPSCSLLYMLFYIISDLTILLDTSVLESFPPDSDKQQALITAIQNFDGYSWA
jgi:hypothetical protein